MEFSLFIIQLQELYQKFRNKLVIHWLFQLYLFAILIPLNYQSMKKSKEYLVKIEIQRIHHSAFVYQSIEHHNDMGYVKVYLFAFVKILLLSKSIFLLLGTLIRYLYPKSFSQQHHLHQLKHLWLEEHNPNNNRCYYNILCI